MSNKAKAAPRVSGGKQKAIAEHNKDRKYLRDLIDKGRKESGTAYKEAWPNAAEWIKQGKSKIFALTKTHDSAERAKANHKAGHDAAFGRRDAVSMSGGSAAHQSYSDTLTSTNNIQFVKPSWGGFQVGGDIAVNQPRSRGKNSLRSVIVHETQHASDHHGHDDFSRFVTELRAYWLGRTFADKSDKKGSAHNSMAAGSGATRTVLSGFDNERQQAIFAHLYNSTSYLYSHRLWKNPKMRRKVQAYGHPTGMNLIDSPRIEDLYKEMSKGAPRLARVKTLLGRLTAGDKKYLQSPGMKPTWQKLLGKSKNSGAIRKAFEAVVGDMSTSAAMGALYAELSKSKPDKKRIMDFSVKLTKKDKKKIRSAGVREKWTALADSKLKGNDRETFRRNVGV